MCRGLGCRGLGTPTGARVEFPSWGINWKTEKKMVTRLYRELRNLSHGAHAGM